LNIGGSFSLKHWPNPRRLPDLADAVEKVGLEDVVKS